MRREKGYRERKDPENTIEGEDEQIKNILLHEQQTMYTLRDSFLTPGVRETEIWIRNEEEL